MAGSGCVSECSLPCAVLAWLGRGPGNEFGELLGNCLTDVITTIRRNAWGGSARPDSRGNPRGNGHLLSGNEIPVLELAHNRDLPLRAKRLQGFLQSSCRTDFLENQDVWIDFPDLSPDLLNLTILIGFRRTHASTRKPLEVPRCHTERRRRQFGGRQSQPQKHQNCDLPSHPPQILQATPSFEDPALPALLKYRHLELCRFPGQIPASHGSSRIPFRVLAGNLSRQAAGSSAIDRNSALRRA